MGNFQNISPAAVALFLATLVLGIFIGIFIDRAVLPPPLLPEMRQLEGRRDRGDFLLRRITDELELSAEQQDEFDRILAGYRQRFGELRRHLHPRFSALRDSLDQQIAAILTPAQREKFEELKQQRAATGRRKPRSEKQDR